MGTKTFNNYEDLLTFTRASKGHALRPVSYGTELVTNGDGSTTTGWDGAYPSNTTLSVSSGSLRATANASGAYGFSQDLSLSVGKLYRVVATIDTDNASGGTANLRISDQANLGGTQTTIATTTGTYYFNFIATNSTTYIGIVDTASTAGEYVEFDSISVKEVTFDQPDGTLTLFEHPDNIPRVEWDADRNRLGLLVEDARTNLVTYSEDFSQSSWSKIRSSVSQSSIQAPDGTISAFVVTPSAGLNTHYIADVISGTSGSRSISFFAKKKEYSVVYVGHGIGAQEGAYFDLDAGTITSEGTDIDASTITPLPNGWYRCAVTFDSVIEPRYAILAPCESSGSTSFNADGTSGVYIWGAQFETGSFPTSYIKTTGATATRSADVASIPVADFGYNQSAGSILIESQTFDITDVGRNFSLSNGTSSNVIRSQSQASNHLIVINSGSVTANLDAGTYSNNVFSKLAGAFKENDIAASIDGGAVVTDTSSNIPTVTKLNIGGRYDGGLPLNGHIKSIQYYPRRLTNAQLQDITS